MTNNTERWLIVPIVQGNVILSTSVKIRIHNSCTSSKVLETEDVTAAIVYALSTPPRVQVRYCCCCCLDLIIILYVFGE